MIFIAYKVDEDGNDILPHLNDQGELIPGSKAVIEDYDSLSEMIQWYPNFDADSVYAVYGTGGKDMKDDFIGFHYTMPYMDGVARAYKYLELNYKYGWGR